MGTQPRSIRLQGLFLTRAAIGEKTHLEEGSAENWSSGGGIHFQRQEPPSSNPRGLLTCSCDLGLFCLVWDSVFFLHWPAIINKGSC